MVLESFFYICCFLQHGGARTRPLAAATGAASAQRSADSVGDVRQAALDCLCILLDGAPGGQAPGRRVAALSETKAEKRARARRESSAERYIGVTIPAADARGARGAESSTAEPNGL